MHGPELIRALSTAGPETRSIAGQLSVELARRVVESHSFVPRRTKAILESLDHSGAEGLACWRPSLSEAIRRKSRLPESSLLNDPKAHQLSVFLSEIDRDLEVDSTIEQPQILFISQRAKLFQPGQRWADARGSQGQGSAGRKSAEPSPMSAARSACLTDDHPFWSTPFEIENVEQTGDLSAAREALAGALELVMAVDPKWFDWTTDVLRHVYSVHPLRPDQTSSRFGLRSGTSEIFFGCSFVSLAVPPLLAAELLVHEASHHYFRMMSFNQKFIQDPAQELWSPIRKMPRPVHFLLLGFHATTNILLFYESVPKSQRDELLVERFEHWLEIWNDLKSILGSEADLSVSGRELLEALSALGGGLAEAA